MRLTQADQHLPLAGKAFLLESGQSSYLSATDGSAPNLSPGVGNFSVELWVKPFLPGVNQGLIGKGAYTTSPSTTVVGWRLNMTSGNAWQIIVADATDSTQVNVTAGTALFSRWQHLLVTADRAGSMTLYMNGASVGSTAITGEPLTWNSTADFVIGCRKSDAAATTLFGAFAIDRIGVWQRLLLADEIRQASQGRRLGDIADRTSLISWWDASFGLNDPVSGYRLTNNAQAGVTNGYPL